MSPNERSRRATRYRSLANAEIDDRNAAMLRRLAEEAEHGLLRVTSQTKHLRILPPIARPPYSAYFGAWRDRAKPGFSQATSAKSES